MPRPRQKALFELGGQWIGREVGKPFLYRYWHCERTGHSRRASLGTEHLEQAKTRLAEIIVRGETKTADSYLSIILENYFLNKTDHLPSKGTARNAGRLFLECWGPLSRVSDLTEANQKKFVKWSLDKKDHAISSVARNLGVLAAAVADAKVTAEVIYNEGAILAKWPEFKPKPARVIYEPTDEELARLLRAPIPTKLRRWILNAMATAGRPEAILQLTPAQRDRDFDLIDLNPEGRRQNKKFRAKVRVLPSQKKWLDAWEKADAKEAKKGKHYANRAYCRYASTDSLDTALYRARDREDVNIPRLTTYSFRHRATSVLRAARVPGEQISFQLGHRRPSERSTRDYGEYAPDYLMDAAAALEAWVTRVLRLVERKPTAKQIRKAA